MSPTVLAISLQCTHVVDGHRFRCWPQCWGRRASLRGILSTTSTSLSRALRVCSSFTSVYRWGTSCCTSCRRVLPRRPRPDVAAYAWSAVCSLINCQSCVRVKFALAGLPREAAPRTVCSCSASQRSCSKHSLALRIPSRGSSGTRQCGQKSGGSKSELLEIWRR